MTKSTKATKTETIVELNIEELISSANELKIDSKKTLAHIAKGDLEGLSKLIDKTKKIAAESAAIDDMVRSSKLDKKSLHLMGVALKGCTEKGFLFYEDSDQGWLRNLLFQIFSSEFKTFLNADKTLANVKRFVTYLESKKK